MQNNHEEAKMIKKRHETVKVIQSNDWKLTYEWKIDAKQKNTHKMEV